MKYTMRQRWWYWIFRWSKRLMYYADSQETKWLKRQEDKKGREALG
jgi:hypothetical protein